MPHIFAWDSIAIAIFSALFSFDCRHCQRRFIIFLSAFASPFFFHYCHFFSFSILPFADDFQRLLLIYSCAYFLFSFSLHYRRFRHWCQLYADIFIFIASRWLHDYAASCHYQPRIAAGPLFSMLSARLRPAPASLAELTPAAIARYASRQPWLKLCQHASASQLP